MIGSQYGIKIKIFADAADKASMLKLSRDPRIKGFTTNPVLMRKAGMRNYEKFARDIVEGIPNHPVSFDVSCDDLGDMELQAVRIASWGEQVYAKVPVTNTQGESTLPLLASLASQGVKLNVTALMTLAHVEGVAAAVAGGPSAFISVSAGRIADTGRDPVPIMHAAVRHLLRFPNMQLVWASPRELLNICQADACGCHVITVPPHLLKKLALIGKDLDEYSLETVKMFYDEAQAAGITLDTSITSSVLNLVETLSAEAPAAIQAPTVQ